MWEVPAHPAKEISCLSEKYIANYIHISLTEKHPLKIKSFRVSDTIHSWLPLATPLALLICNYYYHVCVHPFVEIANNRIAFLFSKGVGNGFPANRK